MNQNRWADLIREVREDWVPPGRPEEDDAKLFARIAAEDAREEANAPTRHPLVWGGVALVAAAATFLVFVRAEPDATKLAVSPPEPRPTPPESDEEALPIGAHAGALNDREGTGEVLIGGVARDRGQALKAGDAITTTEASALFVSDNGSRVTWLVEPSTRVEVQRSKSPLVLALLVGGVEAQVEPTPLGEAFAVDVDGVRIAVHGTHLRVERVDKHVTVDLSEGVVAVGPVPRMGTTQGEVVTAPAHLEFDTDTLGASLRIDRDPAAIRAPVPLLARVAPSSKPDSREPPAAPLEHVDPAATAGPTPPAPPAASTHAEDIIAKGVKACMAAQLRTTGVRVSVSSTLTLEVGEDGAVSVARFNPPLAPEAQECAARVIYKTRFTPGNRDVEIPLKVE